MMAEPCLLIGDIGGTNARFALARPQQAGFSNELTLDCADYETAEQGIEDYLERCDCAVPDVICLAAAGPVVDDSVRFTNNHWVIGGQELRQKFPAAGVKLLNDFEAIAYSIPMLEQSDLSTVGLIPSKLDGKSDFNLCLLGPGTGLGEAGLLGRGGNIYPIVGEGSHAGFAPESRIQFEVLKQLRERYERVSDERLISGPGLENIYWALRKIHGKPATKITTAEIFSRVLANEDVIAAESTQLFYEALGQVAGNLVLALGAFDGVYLAGGIVKRYPDLLTTSSFRSGFENKGRHRSLME
ncbi:MAG: glucokinase, partial [Xanthomonadales bacterium]|nr:glucokinase [Xanthomonadales bacterium]